MSFVLASVALSTLLSQAPPPAVALPSSVAVVAGRGGTWDDEGSVGSGTGVGGEFAYRFRPRWSVIGSVERMAHRRETPGLVFSGRTVFATAGVAYHFGESRVAPYAGGGFGGAFYSGDLQDRMTPPFAPVARSSASTAVYGATGVDVRAGTRVVISPDLRITMCQPQDDFAPWSAIRFGVKAAWRF
jgi:hypothetical protein